MSFDALLIDLDGTLIDTEVPYKNAFLTALNELRVDTKGVQYETLIGLASVDRREILAKWFGSEFPVDLFFDIYRKLRDDALHDRVQLKEGAKSLLEMLETARISFAVVTAASRRTALLRLSQVAITGCLVISRDDVPRSKPDPACYLLAASKLGAVPERCLVVEDSIPGIQAARAASMEAVLVSDLGPAFSKECLVVHDLNNLVALFCHG
jgi:HAD superfamily hydrolase (TIGR01509 family)